MAAEPAQEGLRERVLTERRRHYGPNTSMHYNDAALLIVRGEGTHLYDEQGTEYLDCVNNVAHLGHAHPKVAEAISAQLCTLNTNSRYLHQALTDYTSLLLGTMPLELQVLYMVNSGSEANDLALRIATAARPGATHVVVMAGAYHGHTGALIDMSPYKFWGPGGQGRKFHVHVMPCPDPYRGTHCDGSAAARAAVAQARAVGGRVAAFFAESVLSCGGQIILPQGYLQGVYEVMRAEGAVCVADEVQCGFGRVGEAFWGFETQSVMPDIVTVGKPMGNGFPVSGLITTRALADAFCTGMEYFNTFGGNTAAAVAALATLRCIQQERRQQHAQRVGRHLVLQLHELQRAHPDVVGDVRGLGLMVGLDIVTDGASKAYAPVLANWIKERAKAVDRVLISTDGPYDNVIKIKPPMVFDERDADRVVAALRQVLDVELTPALRAQLLAKERDEWPRTHAQRAAAYEANARELGLPAPTFAPLRAPGPPTPSPQPASASAASASEKAPPAPAGESWGVAAAALSAAPVSALASAAPRSRL